mmetsp:Transcript_74403/g.174618  ORF Transcript_74403/g.174618 Transcript_74403/m.174618 type:complete len:212 (-) Transcript_74403:57-692(-)|eukprot:CAMPEP_0175851326 /NCGR_PEP_ID=MMETSP0107_2-20121207/25593_1 /TAXON_ID=195067 ORGANISM="Goniomonas pacifica, Strain CCMP1869" /NCGR_SAMPLE_ID=MMETSP0107_2 /ASSEMBLY_ACC=CAM_ASM_000203 /LENGTH=211 /DNA_ID=CAMNT_0017166733 /DNA_START=79 /DNA_END=714 /DNA_ORIENTATION=+
MATQVAQPPLMHPPPFACVVVGRNLTPLEHFQQIGEAKWVVRIPELTAARVDFVIVLTQQLLESGHPTQNYGLGIYGNLSGRPNWNFLGKVDNTRPSELLKVSWTPTMPAAGTSLQLGVQLESVHGLLGKAQNLKLDADPIAPGGAPPVSGAPCCYFLLGKCRFGHNCVHPHEPSKDNTCNRGAECRYHSGGQAAATPEEDGEVPKQKPAE